MSVPPSFPLPDAAAFARYTIRPDLETLTPSARDEALQVLVAQNGHPDALLEGLSDECVDIEACGDAIRASVIASLGHATGAPAPRAGLGQPTPPPAFLSPKGEGESFGSRCC